MIKGVKKMPKYDFANPSFKNRRVTFPVKNEQPMDMFMRLAHKYKINVLRSQMLISTTNYMGKIFNRLSYIEIKHDGKSEILRNEREMTIFLKDLKENYRYKIR